MPDSAAISISDPAELAAHIEVAAAGRTPFIVAVAGPPGSGKSTLAEGLKERLGPTACVIPMDGFHLDNDTLKARNLLPRKGAPETFDLGGFAELIDRLRAEKTDSFPTFDRSADRVVPNGGQVPAGTKLLIIEGNYLLFSEPGWADLQSRWDASVWIDVPDAELRKRLIQRWRDHGLDETSARRRAEENDLPNARRVKENVAQSTWVVRH